MLKRWFALNDTNTTANGNGESPNGSSSQGLQTPETNGGGRASKAASAEAPQKPPSFEQICQGASVQPPRLEYGILKLTEMVNSRYLAGVTPEAKRGALLMAMEAAGAEIEDVLQDALVRQRALQEYQEKQQERLSVFEAAKLDENSAIQAELDRITSQYMARIQANVDDIARRQDEFRDWQRRKEQECNRMSETAAFLVPHGSQNGTLAAVLERTGARR